MPLPGSLTTIVVSGTYLKFDGSPESGVVQFVNQAFLQSSSDNIIVAKGTAIATLDANGSFTATLPATNDPQWVPIGFTYNVYERLSSGTRAYVISLPYDGGPVNLADVAPVEAVPPTGSFLPLIGGTVTGNLGVNGNLSVGSSASITGNLLASGTTTVKFGTGSTFNVGEMLSTLMSTGIITGGELNPNVDPSKLDISAMVGYIVDYITDVNNPILIRVSIPSQTVPMDAGSLARLTTWWLVSSAGSIIQQAARPTNTQRRTHIVLGATAQFSGSIFIDQTLPGWISHNPGAQIVDVLDGLGPFKVSGNTITPNGTNLMINTSGGTLFIRATNHFSGSTLTNDPHIAATSAQSPASFHLATQSSVISTTTNLLDVTNYDVGGVVTAIPGGAGTSTIFRVWAFGTNSPPDQLAIQYGQTAHSTLATAVAAIGTGTYITNPNIEPDGVLVAYIAVTKSATNLSDVSQAVFIKAAKFAVP